MYRRYNSDFMAHKVNSPGYFYGRFRLWLRRLVSRHPALATALGVEPLDEGGDVSHWNEGVDWGVASVYWRFGYIKATEGTVTVDGTLVANTQGAKENRVLYGLYHFLRNMNGTAQADHFIDIVTNMLGGDFGDLPMAVDVEVALDAGVVRAFVYRIAERLGYYPLIYTSPHAWNDLVTGDKSWAAVCPLWVANWYTDNPTIPSPWIAWVVHQYTNRGDGHKHGCGSTYVDLDRAKRAWLNQYAPDPPPPEEIVPIKIVAINPWTLAIRAKPEILGKQIGTVTRAQQLPVIQASEDGTYYLITGWIQANKVRDV